MCNLTINLQKIIKSVLPQVFQILFLSCMARERNIMLPATVMHEGIKYDLFVSEMFVLSASLSLKILSYVFFLISECGRLLWPDNQGWWDDRQLTPGIQKVLLCDNGDGLPPHYAGQFPEGQGSVLLPLLPGLQFVKSCPFKPCPGLPRVSSWLGPYHSQTGAHLWWEFRWPMSCWLVCSVLWWTGQELASPWASSVWEEPSPASAVHYKLPHPEAGDPGDSAQSWLCRGLHFLQTW